jgi:hypothetical protein
MPGDLFRKEVDMESDLTWKTLEGRLKCMEEIASQYPLGSSEENAIRCASEAMVELFSLHTSVAFMKKTMLQDFELTENQIIHLRSLGVDITDDEDG